MEVTKTNFSTILPKIITLLDDASFISFDGEFSGLGRGNPAFKFNELDTPAERYIKTRRAVTDYGLIQLGVTIFRFSSVEKKYFTSTFCFFIAGKQNGHYKVDTSSMMFLADNSFDFNKLYTEGLPFISLKDEADRRAQKAEKDLESVPVSTPVKVRDDKAKQFVTEAKEKLEKAIENNEKSCIYSGKTMNSFYRKLLYNNIAPLFPAVLLRSCRGNDHDIEALVFDTIQKKETFCGSSWEDDLNYEMGMTRFVKALLEANKPIVGHNVTLDVLHLVDKFVMDLPETYDEFQSLVRSNLPDVYDTKLIVRDPPFSSGIINTALCPLFEDLTSNYGGNTISLEVEKDCKSYTMETDGQYHDAGYDAFMTGMCFLTMVKVLEGPNWGKKSALVSKKLAVYKNKINFMATYDYSFIDLHNVQSVPKRHKFITVKCPPDFNSTDTRALLSGLDSYRLIWVNSTLFHVIPQSDEDVKNLNSKLEDMKMVAPFSTSIMMYTSYLNNSEGETNISSQNSTNTSQRRISKASSNGSSKNCGSTPSGGKGKRRSSNAESPELEALERRDLKRLKSVGSEQLSNLSLDSPLNENKSLLDKVAGEDAKKAEEFAVPDDW